MAVTEFAWPTPRSAYIHVPFCRHRCGYCNFSVIANRDDLIDRYLIAIDRELATLAVPEIDTVFIGGGTPTHLDLAALERLLETITCRFRLAPHTEWSVEANPEDITDQKLLLLESYGVNRISLGIQSFDNEKLCKLERGHRGEAAAKIVRAVAAKIRNVSIDLIFAAPGESVSDWHADLNIALSLPITHLSTYALTFEKGTSFWNRRNRGDLRELGDAMEIELYRLARQLTAVQGLSQYEISSFAREGDRCRHNLAYWRGQPWFAAGPGAARFVNGRREMNHRSTTQYLKRVEAGQDPVTEIDSLTPTQYARERVAFGVRMIDGVDLNEIYESTGIDLLQLCSRAVSDCHDQGLIHFDQGRIRLTEQGILFADTVAAEFLE